MKRLFAAGLLVLLLNSNEAFAEAVSLVCKGTFYNYETNTVKSTVGPASANLDIENNRLQTPVGGMSDILCKRPL